MKEFDIKTIYDNTVALIDNLQPLIIQYWKTETVASFVTAVYLNIDARAVTLHVNQLTVIVSDKRVSVILSDKSTYIKTQMPICLYDDLLQDLQNILDLIEICIISVSE